MISRSTCGQRPWKCTKNVDRADESFLATIPGLCVSRDRANQPKSWVRSSSAFSGERAALSWLGQRSWISRVLEVALGDPLMAYLSVFSLTMIVTTPINLTFSSGLSSKPRARDQAAGVDWVCDNKA